MEGSAFVWRAVAQVIKIGFSFSYDSVLRAFDEEQRFPSPSYEYVLHLWFFDDSAGQYSGVGTHVAGEWYRLIRSCSRQWLREECLIIPTSNKRVTWREGNHFFGKNWPSGSTRVSFTMRVVSTLQEECCPPRQVELAILEERYVNQRPIPSQRELTLAQSPQRIENIAKGQTRFFFFVCLALSSLLSRSFPLSIDLEFILATAVPRCHWPKQKIGTLHSCSTQTASAYLPDFVQRAA